ncbi:MAG: Tm-1-like ATP-binding domain-containing protein, partial [Thermodesulfobacteriota bacterium]|nr:Tm-1-like ATP-binding domain-containing protein [Thermodesulfobacteriota bacterium]
MTPEPVIAIIGTFDTKGEEHLFLKKAIEARGLPALTINIGTRIPSPFEVDIDLFTDPVGKTDSRDEAIQSMLQRAQQQIRDLYEQGRIQAVISAGGGSGTHLCTGIMRVLPLGVPKVMVSTVASRDMSTIVGTKDITMIHSVVDLLGVNRISGGILDKAAAAVCAMAQSQWQPEKEGKRIALSFFGFITRAAEHIKKYLENLDYEVIAFHANGTGGMALEELAAEGYFDGILDLATHELADALMNGYCGNIGPVRFQPVPDRPTPRLIVPGGLDCAVLEFTRADIPPVYRNRKIFFYDFRSAIRLNIDESVTLAHQLAARLNRAPTLVKVINPQGGWSEADHPEAPLYDPEISDVFISTLTRDLDQQIEIITSAHHINDRAFAQLVGNEMDKMIRKI